MATTKQRKLAKVIVENAAADKPLTAGQMLEKVGYSQNLVKQPGRVIATEGVQEALEEMGFTEENAMRVVTEIMLNGDVNPVARLKATDQLFKVKGTYAPEKTVNLNYAMGEEHKERANNAIRQLLSGRDTE